MGDPKKPKKKYNTPSHPWEKERIDVEKKLMKDYGLANKKEIWKSRSLLQRFKGQAKKCATAGTPQLEKEKTQLLQRLQRLGLLPANGGLDEVLGLGVEDLLKRRLQSLVFEKKLSTTVKQARQFIVHGHVIVDSKHVTVPSYIVPKEEENKIALEESIQKAKEVKNG